MGYTPVIIIGAPRSGTNMLRDALTEFPGIGTWPCDEINYVWRHGNVRHPSDEFTADMASDRVQRFVRRQFDWVARRYRVQTVVEKTCANSLRVPFVDAVMPDARYVFVRRDGLDAIASAMQRWRGKADVRYLVRKARFVPAGDLPYYGIRYLGHRAYRLFSREGRVGSWGPRLDGMDDLLARYSLAEVCALQWRRCVESAHAALAAMPAQRWIEVSYEDFVRDPAAELGRIGAFLGSDLSSEHRQRAVGAVRGGSIGKGRAALEPDARARIEPIVGDTLARFGYA
jgi:hypothetical protein